MGALPIDYAENACEECLPIAELARLGRGDAPGFLVETGREFGVVVDHRNRYWVPQPGGATQIYAEDGKYLRTVGTAGQGPMGFAQHWMTQVDDAGNVHVVDPINRRLSIVSSSFELLSTHPLPSMFYRGASLADGRLLFQGRVTTPESVGLLMHIARNGEVEVSFGTPNAWDDDKPPAATQTNVRRQMAQGPDGIIYSIEDHRIYIEAWNLEGERITGLAGPPLNAAAPEPRPFSRDNPFVHRVQAITVDGQNRLWISIFWLRPDWQDRVEEIMDPRGAVYLMPKNRNYSDTYLTRILVVDLDSLEITASQSSEGLLSTFLPGGRAAAVVHRSDGEMEIAIWELGEPAGGGESERPD